MLTRARTHAAYPVAEVSELPTAAERNRSSWAAAGGILGAIAASSCCIVPLVLFSLGISGSWISNLTALEPYKPVFIAVALGFLTYGFWLVYRSPRECEAGEACARPLPNRIVKTALWVSSVLVTLALFWNWIAPVVAPLLLGL